MAFRINTVEYGWETSTLESSGSIITVGSQKQLYIPETGSRTFLAADLEVYLRDANQGSTISNITTYQLTCSIDSNIQGEQTTNTITMTGDHCNLGFKSDFSNLFNTRFTGSVHTVQPRILFPQANSGVWTGHSFKLIVTYQFEDTDVDSMIKTVRLPIDSAYGALSATAMTVFGQKQSGYFNIPPLDTFLPESNKKIRDIWIEFRGVDASAAATNVSMAVQIDSGSTETRFRLTGAMNTDTSYIDFKNISGSIDTSVGHTLKASASLASRLQSISPLLMCTYEYSSLNSTSVLNSCIIPFNPEYYTVNNGAYNTLEGNISFLVPEQNPSLVNSALIFNSLTTSTTNRNFFINNRQILTNYATTRGTVGTGIPTLNVRFDQQASQSANFQIASGFNNLSFKTTGTTTVVASGLYGYLLLNYSSSKLNDIHGHNKTVYFSTGSFGPTSTTTVRTFNLGPTQSFHPSISSSYYIHNPLLQYQANTSTALTFPHGPLVTVNSSSIHLLYNGSVPGGEMAFRQVPYASNAFLNYPNQPTSSVKLDYFTQYSGVIFNGVLTANSWYSTYTTFQQNIFRITGSLTNCSQAGVNYQVDILLSGSNVPQDPIYILSTSGSGTTKWFTFDWYEDINKLYAVSTYPEYKVSNQITASNSNGLLTIDFATSAGGEKSFTFIG